MTVAEGTSNANAYDTLAADYDRLTAHHDYGLWVGVLAAELERHRPPGTSLLDVGCGTGRSTAAWADAGYCVVGVDSSAPMLARARERLPDLRLHQADVRDLRGGCFDVVAMLCDVVNCVAPADLAGAFGAVGRCLADDGLVVFDANTVHAYRTYFAVTEVAVDADDALIVWRGAADASFAASEAVTLTIESFRQDAGAWQRTTSTQRQHHHPPDAVGAALAHAGLDLLDVYGQGFDAVPQRPLDEERHTKAVYIARRAERR